MAFWTPTRQKPAASPIEALRARYDVQFQRFGALPEGLTASHGQLGPIAGEWIRTGTEADGRAILYFHGGGGVAGSPRSHQGLAGKLVAASGVPAFLPAYRLAPDCFFPAAVRDGIDAYRALLAKGHAGPGIAVAGDEIGGGLAFAVTLAIRNAGLEMPACVAAMSPWADLSLSGLSLLHNAASDRLLTWETLFVCARHVLRKSNPGDAYASPAYASLKDFPPVMVHAGANEILRDDASKLGDRAAEAGVPVSVEIYDGMGHLFQAEPAPNEARVSLTRLGQFIRTRTSAPG
jgi:acetyl esterase/lipase